MATTSTETREVRATAKYVRVSPGKARLVIDLIRKKLDIYGLQDPRGRGF
jgi:large subunit ribosomal protein L22